MKYVQPASVEGLLSKHCFESFSRTGLHKIINVQKEGNPNNEICSTSQRNCQ